MLQAIEKHLPGHIGLFCRSSAQTCSACSRDLRPLARPTSFPIAKRPCFEKSSTDAWHLPLDLDSSLASRHKVFRVLWDPNTIQRSFDSWPVLKHGGRPCVDKFQPQLFCVHNFLTCNAVTDTNFKNYSNVCSLACVLVRSRESQVHANPLSSGSMHPRFDRQDYTSKATQNWWDSQTSQLCYDEIVRISWSKREKVGNKSTLGNPRGSSSFQCCWPDWASQNQALKIWLASWSKKNKNNQSLVRT